MVSRLNSSNGKIRIILPTAFNVQIFTTKSDDTTYVLRNWNICVLSDIRNNTRNIVSIYIISCSHSLFTALIGSKVGSI